MRKLAIVLVALLIMALPLASLGCACGCVPGCGCACERTVEREATPTPTPKNITSGEMLAMLHENGGEVTIKGTSLTAIIDNETYRTVVPASFDPNKEFEAGIAAGTVSISFEPSYRAAQDHPG